MTTCPHCGQPMPGPPPIRFLESLPTDYRGLAAWGQLPAGMAATGAPDHEVALDVDIASATICAEEPCGNTTTK